MEVFGVVLVIVMLFFQFVVVFYMFVIIVFFKSENFNFEVLVIQFVYLVMVQVQIYLFVVQFVVFLVVVFFILFFYFMKGFIIQLVNGELKKVEDLKIEDFIQSVEISNDLKIDFSIVERIEDSYSLGVVVIQFVVGEY